MRLLLVVHQFPPEFSAGTETLALRAAQELSRRGHQVAVLTGVGVQNVQLQSPPVYLFDGLPVWQHSPPPIPALGFNCRIRMSYQRQLPRDVYAAPLLWWQPDALLIFHLRRLSLNLLEICTDMGIPYHLVLTDYWAGCTTGQLLLPDQSVCSGPDFYSANCARHLVVRRWSLASCFPGFIWRFLAVLMPALQRRPMAFRAALARACSVIVSSQIMADQFARLGFDSSRWHVIPHGIDTALLRMLPARSPWTSERGPLQLGFIGTLRPAKGAHILLEALAGWRGGQSLGLTLYGSLRDDPAYVARLRRLIALLPATVVVSLAGSFPPDQLYVCLRRLDLLVIPSLWMENTPLILLQALAAHVPVVVSAVEGMRREVRNGVDGVLVPPGDHAALATALAELAADPGALSALARAPREVREIYAYVQEIEPLLRSAGEPTEPRSPA